VPIRQRYDRILLAAAILQTAVGLALLASASWLVASERYGRPGSYFFTWQAAAAMVGLGVLVVCMHLRSDLLTDPRLASFGIGASWVLLVAVFLMPPVANTHRWLSIGGVSVQPSVLARLAVIVFGAVQLERAQREGWPIRRLSLAGGAGFVTAVLVAVEPDLGSAALIVLVLAAMAFTAGVPLRQLAVPGVAVLVALTAAVLVSPYRLERVRAFIDPDSASAAAWQGYQSLVALGSGGLVGRGYGSGMQKLFFLPEPHTDFIFSITGEELGLIGVLALVSLAGLIVWRGLRIAMALPTPRHALLAFGLTFAFAAQALLHMVVCLNLVPPKGIPLPLVSYGKTDLLVTLMSVGLLLNLSRGVKT
jgi:cell division protein FtsW